VSCVTHAEALLPLRLCVTTESLIVNLIKYQIEIELPGKVTLTYYIPTYIRFQLPNSTEQQLVFTTY